MTKRRLSLSWRSMMAVITLLMVVASAVSAPSARAAASCRVTYTIVNQWPDGFQADVTLTNTGDPLSRWTIAWAFPNGQAITQLWNGSYTQSGANVSVSSLAWNSAVATNASVSFGFTASWSGANARPASFSVNGTLCGAATTTPTPTTPTATPSTPTVTPTTPTVTTPTPTTPTATPSTPTVTPTTPTTTTTPTPGTHVSNPFAGARGYINPDYAARVRAEAAAVGGALGTKMARVADYSTAVWMDRIAAIAGSASAMGLRAHLDAALTQQQQGTGPVVITVVIYDLPNRDCAALASNGELQIAQNGLNRYKTEYIDPIAAILADAKYRNLRIATVVEPDSLPNLVTNTSIAKCAEAQSSGAYVQGVQYAINKLHAIPNVYVYLDIAHSGWLGWDDNFSRVVQLYTTVVAGTTAGLRSIDGLVTNTANYTPLEETYLPNPSLTVGSQPIRSARFYEWNPIFDEVDFATALRNAFLNAGFPSELGMLIDTSRNGWGGAARPSGASGSTVDSYVDSGRLDRRLHRGNWCNQSGAGIGARPQASPLPGFDAYVWVKPPGESDGISTATPNGPNEEGKQHDRMCDPAYTSGSGFRTGALAGAPHAGAWFPAQFRMLVENAYPALQ